MRKTTKILLSFMLTVVFAAVALAVDYDYYADPVKAKLLASEVAASSIGPSSTGITTDGTNVTVSFGVSLSTGDELALGVVVTNHPLNAAKSLKLEAITSRTIDVLEEGVLYDGYIFNLGDYHRQSYLDIYANSNLVVWPKTIRATTTNGAWYAYSLADSSLYTFYTNIVGNYFSVYTNEVNLIEQVYSATNVAGVDAIIDNR